MTTWPSLAAAPPCAWAHFAALQRILQRHEDATGIPHLATMCAPDGVSIEDDADATGFIYRDVSYQYDRELEVLFELRPGMIAAYTRTGTVAFVTRTGGGVRPLLDCPDRESPTKEHPWN